MTELELVSQSRSEIVQAVRDKVRSALAIKRQAKTEQHNAPYPRYDDEFFDGVAWLNTL
jgi:hypothetical protein